MEVPWVGRHPVNVGASLARSLKARKGAPVKQSKHLPVHDFYLFRYNFKPESIDTTKPGTVESTSGSEVRVERASIQPDEVHLFRGKEEEAKEFECVLIYNEADKMFTLEKLDSSLMLTHGGRATKSRSLPASTTTTPSPPVVHPPQEDEEDIEAQLDRELNTAIQEIDDEFEELVPDGAPSSSFRGISNSAKDEEDIPLSATTQKNKVKPVARIKDMPSSNRQPDSLSRLALSSTPSSAKGKNKRMQEFADEETLVFGQAAKPVKRSRPSTPKQPPGGGFALPGSGSSFAHLPSAPAPLPSAEPPQPPQPEFPAGQDDSDSDSDWDEVIQPVTQQPLQVDVDQSIFGDDDGEDMGFDHQLEALMNEQLNEVDDGDGDVDADGDGEEIEHGDLFNSLSGPVSMNALARSQGVDDDDDSSSSDDSDDD